MTTTTWTADHLAALETAMLRGLKSVSYGDFRREFQSLDEMRRLREDMRRSLGMTSGFSRTYAVIDRGT